MNGKTAKKNRKLVDISKIRLGLDVQSGRVIAGVADEEGVIVTSSDLVQDVTEDFFGLVQEITELRMLAMQKDKKDNKIVLATEQEKRIITGK